MLKVLDKSKLQSYVIMILLIFLNAIIVGSMISLKNKIIKFKKFSTIISDRKNETRHYAKTGNYEYRNITATRHWCLPVFFLTKVMFHIVDTKLLRVSCIWWLFLKVFISYTLKRQFSGASLMYTCIVI